jgi:hypothetical protein
MVLSKGLYTIMLLCSEASYSLDRLVLCEARRDPFLGKGDPLVIGPGPAFPYVGCLSAFVLCMPQAGKVVRPLGTSTPAFVYVPRQHH